MTPFEFISKWKGHALTERAAAQEHFIDVCRLVGHPTPAEADKTGESYAFEKGVTKTGGGDGFADVWKRGYFGWEYKKKKANLEKAIEQLTRYASALENPPLQVACDTDRFRIVTAWTNTLPKVIEFGLDELADPAIHTTLGAVFHDPQTLKPAQTRAALTASAAKDFITIAERLQHRHDHQLVAHFINQLVFCFFAEDVKLLPEDYFTRLLKSAMKRPGDSAKMLDSLFAAMEKGGFHGVEEIAHFNGGLFDGKPALPLKHDELLILSNLGKLHWDKIDPTIFGTLFERFLDPEKRAQIGAHYTDETKIMMIVEPVIVRPLLAEWAAVKARIEDLLTGAAKPGKSDVSGKKLTAKDAASGEQRRFLERLRAVRVLDPACGSGNFLYLALQAVKDIENRIILECEALGLPREFPLVGPEILLGIEINRYAADLARTTIWIGYIQWKIRNAIFAPDVPVLRKLDGIENRDALVTLIKGEDGAELAVEAHWPEAEFIVGNPPFLGGKLLRSNLGDDYVGTLFATYDKAVPREADLVTYWFEKARGQMAAGRLARAGLVSTNSIRGGANRKVLERLTGDATITEAWADEPWIVDGAAVRVSLVCFVAGQTPPSALPGISPTGGEIGASALRLDGKPVAAIHADLTAGVADLTLAKRLKENAGVVFQGIKFGGPFELARKEATSLLREPLNVNGRANSDVIRNWFNGQDITRRLDLGWCIDFGAQTSEPDAAYFEAPYAHLKAAFDELNALLASEGKRQLREREARTLSAWWLHQRPRGELREAIRKQTGYLATPEVAKHRIFMKFSDLVVPSGSVYVFARDDDTTFGILHSRFHEAWSLRMGTWLGVGNDPRYTPTTTFETFAFPQGLTPDIEAEAYAADPRAIRIAAAARELDDKRRAWLNPPDLVTIVPEIVPTAAPGEAPVKYPDRIVAKDEEAKKKLKERTLTNLYNQRPAWLAALHEALDRAVAAAYGWPENISTDEALEKLLALNMERAAAGR